MIGKPEWFTYRIFGWGLRPRTKEGWMYIGVFCLIALGWAFLPLTETIKFWGLGILIAILMIDVLHIMTQLPKHHDERENYHQLLIERNASFVGVVGLLLAAVYESWKVGFLPQENWLSLPFSPLFLYVLLAMALAKGLTSLYLHMKS